MTYHGSGQIVAYPLFDLRPLKIGVRELVRRIEQAQIDTLDTWNIAALRHAGAPGIYVSGAKIAALGLCIRRGCSFHGLAFNVAMDLEPFGRINPCGFCGFTVTQMIDLVGLGSLAAVEDVLITELGRQFGFRIETTRIFPVFCPNPLTAASLLHDPIQQQNHSPRRQRQAAWQRQDRAQPCDICRCSVAA